MLDAEDGDLGSGGVLLLPDQTQGPHAHLLVQAGKEGSIYLVDRDKMGRYNTQGNHIVQEWKTRWADFGPRQLSGTTMYILARPTIR